MTSVPAVKGESASPPAMTPRVGDENPLGSALNGFIKSPKSVAFPADAIVINR